ncbi:RNA 2',3'-cyclic phosphodiesterase [Rhodanobacter sp. C01]|uniref:RNA 2',3'-cyclic phosphodiesterase n=1 Tax=Rhodanobacter sp. C01 TaxID=1945856 RepID=UPI0011159486|nr:RNA 2',3'-cyclic phosphodiesterase [Rhodanobacter sp. C01]
MPETHQSDLLGGIASTEVHRLFFALMPDAPTRERLAAVAVGLKAARPDLRARWIHPDRYHATLHFLGDHVALRPSLVDGSVAAADKVRAMLFTWTLDTATSFRGREPPCVLQGVETCEPLQQLWQALGKSLALAVQGVRFERSFTPHVTLAYSHGAMLQELAVEPVTWPVTEFALIHHVVGQGAYQILGRWPLADS